MLPLASIQIRCVTGMLPLASIQINCVTGMLLLAIRIFSVDDYYVKSLILPTCTAESPPPTCGAVFTCQQHFN